MKKYSSRFTVEDKMRESKASKEQIEKRRQLLEEYAMWCADNDKMHQEEKPERLELRRGECSSLGYSTVRFS